jgi:hypothetical protein
MFLVVLRQFKDKKGQIMGEKKLQVTLVFVILIKSRSCPNS